MPANKARHRRPTPAASCAGPTSDCNAGHRRDRRLAPAPPQCRQARPETEAAPPAPSPVMPPCSTDSGRLHPPSPAAPPVPRHPPAAGCHDAPRHAAKVAPARLWTAVPEPLPAPATAKRRSARMTGFRWWHQPASPCHPRPAAEDRPAVPC